LGIAVASAELGGLGSRSAAEIERVAVAAAEEDELEESGGGGRRVEQMGSKITVVRREGQEGDVVAKV